MSLTFDKVSEVNRARSEAWHKGSKWSTSDWGVAMVGEAGEVCDAIKKLNRYRDGLQDASRRTPEKLVEDISKEIADTYLYLDLLAGHLGFRMEDLIRQKFNEVSEQRGFPHKL